MDLRARLLRLDGNLDVLRQICAGAANGAQWVAPLQVRRAMVADALARLALLTPDEIRDLGAALDLGTRYGLGDWGPLQNAPGGGRVAASTAEKFAVAYAEMQRDVEALRLFGRVQN